MKIRGGLIADGLMLIFFAVMFYLSLDWPEKSRGFPLLIGVVGMGFSVCLVVSGLLGRGGHLSRKGEKGDALPAGTGGMILWLAVLFGVTIIFGFWVGSVLFMTVFIRIFGRESWKTTISITSILVAAIYITLSMIMKIPIYGGVLKLTPY